MRSRKARRKSINSAILPVAVNASPSAGKAVISITSGRGVNGANGNKVVPVAVRRASGEVVIPAVVNAGGGRKRAVQIRVAVSKPMRKRRRQQSLEIQLARRSSVPQQDPVTNLITSGTHVEENAVSLAAQFGKSALDVVEYWSNYLLNRGVRLSKAAERTVEPVARALEPTGRHRAKVLRFRAPRRRYGVKISA